MKVEIVNGCLQLIPINVTKHMRPNDARMTLVFDGIVNSKVEVVRIGLF